MKRYLSVWLADWPLDRLRRTRRQARPAPAAKPARLKPFVLYDKSANGLTVVAANAPARAAGIETGLRLADAKATLPYILSEEIDRAADLKELTALAMWLVRFSPLAAFDGEDGLMLETTGCDHLFGSEAAMAAELSRRLAQAGYTHQIAVAGTPGAAHALARGTGLDEHPSLPSGEERGGLAHLPMAALRLSPETLTLLRRFGLTRIGQLYDIDRQALTRRFRSREAAHAVCLRLDQALGRRAEPFAPLRPAPEYAERLPCPEPLTSPEGVRDGLRQLTEKLCASLSSSGLGAQGFAFRAFHCDGAMASVSVNAARPVHAPEHLLRLFREKLEGIDPGFGIDLLLLEAARTAPMETGSHPLSGDLAGSDFDSVAIAALSDRISARLGEGAVTLTARQARHPPHKAERQMAYMAQVPDKAPQPLTGPRPVRMLARPEQVSVMAQVPDGPPLQFVWRRRLRRVVRADGPERIAPEWWTHLPQAAEEPGNLPRTRDYYRIEDNEGRRYWVFREGLYDDGRGALPDWFMQGLFA